MFFNVSAYVTSHHERYNVRELDDKCRPRVSPSIILLYFRAKSITPKDIIYVYYYVGNIPLDLSCYWHVRYHRPHNPQTVLQLVSLFRINRVILLFFLRQSLFIIFSVLKFYEKKKSKKVGHLSFLICNNNSRTRTGSKDWIFVREARMNL